MWCSDCNADKNHSDNGNNTFTCLKCGLTQKWLPAPAKDQYDFKKRQAGDK